MLMNGEDGRSGPIQYGGAREKDIGVPTGARATIFATGSKQQENAKQEEEQQTNLKKHNQKQTKRNQTQTTETLSTFNQQAKRAEQKEAKTHRAS